MLLRGTGPDLGHYSRRFPFPERTMLHVLRQAASEDGNRTWLVFDSRDRLTFGDALQQVYRVGNAVTATCGPGSNVALFLRNQVEFMPTLYGVMAARCVAVPINSELRGPLLERLLAASSAEILVVAADMVGRLASLSSPGRLKLVVVVGEPIPAQPTNLAGIRLMRWDEWLAAYDASPPPELPDSTTTALIQFTSGTTGRPKGAIYSHHFLYLYSSTQAESQERHRDDIITSPLPLYHVAALHHVAGASLHARCCGNLKSRFSASAFWSEAAEDRATFSIILGTMAAILLKTVPHIPPHRMKSMFCVPLPTDAEEFEHRFGVSLLWQGYGMTEISPHPMHARMEPGVPPGTIGRPVAWMDYGVVDEHDCLLPPGEIGQLVYRPLLPYSMASGYFEDPVATVNAFRNFMFHTGDLATYDADGRVRYMGRTSDRIRHGGENISAVELESVAARHPAVIEAAAFAVSGEFGEDDVKLDVVLTEDCDLAELHAWLTEQLPRFMVPRYLERRKDFPKSASQKIEKFKLAEDALDRPGVVEFVLARRQ
jgi:crotonobetaine/carnitine-CoA ligase